MPTDEGTPSVPTEPEPAPPLPEASSPDAPLSPLTERIAGSSRFAEEFAAPGPRDKRGRSLRELDLTKRMFRYPCSYLIYSSSFAALPKEAKSYVYRRLHEILDGGDESPKFRHLTPGDRRAVREILRDTLPDFS